MRQTAYLILCFFLSFAATAAPAQAKRVALVIGNDDYGQVTKLKKAAADARAVSEALKAIGFEVLSAENVSRREMNSEVQRFVSRLEAGDEAVFFYAGHGVEIDDRNFLLPTDIPSATPGQEGFVTSEAIPVDQILSRIRARGTRVSILVLDACRDNPFPKAGTRSLGGTRGLARMAAPEGAFIIYSAGTGQTALDRLSNDDDNPNSVFTRKLIPLVSEPGLPLVQMARRLRRDVQALARTVSHDQRPAYYDEITGDFFFAGRSPEVADQGLGKPQLSLSPAAQAWAATKDTESVAILESFIARFPDSAYAGFAKARLGELEERQEKKVAVLPPAAVERPAGAEPPIHECDRLAAHPLYAAEGVSGTDWDDIPTDKAIQTCRMAVAAYPETARFKFQLARALHSAEAYDEAREYYLPLAKADHIGAALNLGLMYGNGYGVAKTMRRQRAGFASPPRATTRLR